MSDNSRSDSYSSQKSRFTGRSGRRITASEATEALRKGFGHISDMTRNMGATLQNAISANKEQSVFSKASKEVDDYGYEKYNIDDGIEIYISKVPETALFNDGEPVNVRATSGNFVGTIEPPEHISMETDAPSTKDPRSLFTNVNTGRNNDETIHGITGTVVDGHVQVDNSFLNKMSSRPHVEYEAPVEDVPVMEASVAEPAPAVGPEPLMDAPVFDTVEDADAPIIQAVVEEEFEEPVIATPHVATFVEIPEEEAAQAETVRELVIEETPVEEAPAAEAPVEEADAEDDSWMYEDDPEAEEILMNHSEESEVIEFTEVPVEEPIVTGFVEAEPAPVGFTEAPVEEPVAMAFTEAAEAPMEEAAAEPVAFTEAPVEEPVVTGFVEAAEAPAEAEPAPVGFTEAPVEEHIEAVPTLGESVIEGLYVESSEDAAESGAVNGAGIASVASAPMAVTGSEAVAVKNPLEPEVAIKGMDEAGADFLPPMADPVRRRPHRAFRFHNGVLQNIDSKKDESDEGLRGPFELTVGQTVSQEPEVLRIPPVEIDDETEVMRLTLPELDVDEESYSVAFSGDVIPEDGMEAVFFAPAPEPAIEIEDEVADIMKLTIPGLDAPVSGFWDYEDIPSDGMEAMCFEKDEEPVYDASCIGLGAGFKAIAAAAPVSAIGAPAEVRSLPAAQVMKAIAAAQPSIEQAEADPIQEALPEPEEAVQAAEETVEETVPAVTFGFGNGSGMGSVCFSF